MKFFGLQTMRRNILPTESPDCRDGIIDGRGNWYTRAGIVRVQQSALGSGIMDGCYLKSDDCVNEFDFVALADGTIITVSDWTITLVNKGAYTAAGDRPPFIFEITEADSAVSTAAAIYNFYFPVGDFDVQVDYELITWGDDEREHVGLGAIIDGVQYTVNRSYEGGNVYLAWSSIGDSTTVATSDTSGKLRLVRTGAYVANYYWNASTDNWVLIDTFTVGTNSGYYAIGLNNAAGYTNPTAKARMSNFNINYQGQ